jgi:hypothetical protein
MLHQDLLDAKYDPNQINPQPEKTILHNLKNVNLKKEKKESVLHSTLLEKRETKSELIGSIEENS